MGLIKIQTLKIIFLAYVGTVFKQSTKKSKVLKDLKKSGVSGFSFWAVEPSRKDGKRLRKPHSSGQLISGVLFPWVKIDRLN